MDISDWRNQIDEIDTQLITLFNQRTQYAIEIGKIKRQQNLPFFDAKRESAILQQLVAKNPGPLSHHAIQHIFQTLMEETRATEETHSEVFE